MGEKEKAQASKADKTPKERKNEWKVLVEAQKEAAADVFTACLGEKKVAGDRKMASTECMKQVNEFWVTSGGKSLKKAETKALLKQAAGKKAQAKSKECNQKDLKDDERNMCIKGMLTDLKGQTSGKHGKAPSKLKRKQEAFKAQRKPILECKKMDAGDEKWIALT